MYAKEVGSLRIAGLSIDKALFFRIWITVLHVVGIIGLSIDASRPLFQFLTPIHLLACAGTLFYFQEEWSVGFLAFLIAVFSVGMVSEIIGVQTGMIFGDYVYGDVLGPKVLGVPLVIGLNWLILAYMAGHFAQRFIKRRMMAAILGAIGMVVLDIFIEPVAVRLGFWTWYGKDIPLTNYVGWFLVAFVTQILYHYIKFGKKNVVSSVLFLNIALFFVLLGITLGDNP